MVNRYGTKNKAGFTPLTTFFNLNLGTSIIRNANVEEFFTFWLVDNVIDLLNDVKVAKEFESITKWWNKGEESDIAWKVNIKTIIERGYDLDIKNPTKQEEEHEYNSEELMDMLNVSFEKSHKLLNQLKQAVN